MSKKPAGKKPLPQNPIRLDDLAPPENVRGGAAGKKFIFGSLDNGFGKGHGKRESK